jgi:hypothetical protein
LEKKMSDLETKFAEIVRQVVREELQSLAPAKDEGLMTAEEVAGFLRYPDKQSVYKLKREGKLTPCYLGEGTLRFEKSEVMRFIRDSRREHDEAA